MRGSLALWCDTVDDEVQGHTPQLELHFNMWLDLKDEKNVLDIGILFKEARPLRRVYLYFPAKIKLEQIEDLSSNLEDSTTLSAVFNDMLTVGRGSQDRFEAKRSGQIAFHVARLDLKDDIMCETIQETNEGEGTVLLFQEHFLAKLSNLGDHYIRFRIPLVGDIASLFTSKFDPHDRMFLSAFYRTDVVEFRVNERRNIGAGLRARYPNMQMPTISAIHYFLVRDLATELVRSHADFRKMRRLEPLLWNNYLAALGKKDPEKMVIYHWRAGGESTPADDFIAFALFRVAKPNPLLYLVAIILLGAGGSATQLLSTQFFSSLGLGMGKDDMRTQLAILTLIFAIVIGIYILASIRFVQPQKYLRRFLDIWRKP